MKCLYPVIVGESLFRCGKCVPCRRLHGAMWTHRIMLEASTHVRNSFVTVTYDPGRFFDPGGVPRDVSLFEFTKWLKRLRKRYAPNKLRYFAVAEYGDRTCRPHYHAAIFGIGCAGGPRVLTRGGGFECQCDTCSAVRKSWIFGHVQVGMLSIYSAAYIARYILKRTAKTLTAGRVPEFARMSLHPGLGVDALPDVALAMMSSNRWEVPHSLCYGGSKQLPLGRYLRKHLAELSGRTLNGPRPSEELRLLRESARACKVPVELLEKVLAEDSANHLVYEPRELRRETI